MKPLTWGPDFGGNQHSSIGANYVSGFHTPKEAIVLPGSSRCLDKYPDQNLTLHFLQKLHEHQCVLD